MSYKRRKKSYLGTRVLALVLGTTCCVTAWHLIREAKGGDVVSPPAIVSLVSNEDHQETDNHIETYVNETVQETPVVDLEINPSVYDILSEKGYHLNDYPNFQQSLLDSYSYQAFDHNLGVTTTDVNFRTGPSTDYDIIETLSETTSVDLIAKCDNGWYLVQRNGSLGFIRGDYIREVNDEALMGQMQNLPQIVPVVQATTNVNIRPESNTDKPEYGLLRAGNSLEMVRKLDNGWYEVIYEGKLAYVHGDYVREAFAIQGDYSKFVAMNVDAPVYDVPYGVSTGSIPQYEVAKVYGEVDGFYYVECNGQIGYVAKSQCSSLNGTYVIVDISDQTVSLYNGTELILTSDVVTGADNTPSDIGLFDIDAKQLNATLSGPGYSVGVDYWMPYNGGEGLHDASWRGSFGGSIYHNSGSHGCVNMPRSTAEKIYNTVSVGDQVLVKR